MDRRPPLAWVIVLQSTLCGRAPLGRAALTYASAAPPSAAPTVSSRPCQMLEDAFHRNIGIDSKLHSSYVLPKLSAVGAGHWHITEQRIDLTRKVSNAAS